ncbi:hypothetical protein BDF21DRAFT_396817 [Thamnidium elegans]|uniref:F-box domain-containing protein n=1 Tax=Thamnidium elegans TaxID=101142 RepID=A0A8H7SQV1_9FUNG|nr:hypothetical protein INT48_009742 [Thamnidium elegans]KAI8087133.1 hypothetical protein BDF21DRAFT_396817 [Thamnidium elegans]
MSALPHEVLTLTFGYLRIEDLLQCQLTSKQWHQASVTHLYSSQYLSSDQTAALYVRTISNSPQLGKYLNSIVFDMFEKNSEGILFDKDGILDAIIQYCPFVTRIEYFKEDPQFWAQLMHAATQGQLSRLKSLPEPSSTSLRLYIFTALLFKNSLVSLLLRDDDYSFGPQLAHLGAYRTLCDQIDQFKNLEDLHLDFLCDKHLSYFDGLIDKCHHLKEFTLGENIKKIIQLPNELEPTIRPRPDIHSFECNWKVIHAESQLKYVIRKFPNLKKLTIWYGSEMNGDNILNYTRDTLTKFIRYAISIPYFDVRIDANNEDLLNIWAEFIKTKNGSKRLTIEYQNMLSNSCNNIELSSESGIQLVFPLVTNDDEPPHIRFFSRVGETVQSIVISQSDSIPRINGERSATIDWLFDILQLCPLMEEITMYNPSSLSPSRNTLKYHSVKRLNIEGFEYTNSNNFLNCVSLNLPNLNQLYFVFYFVKKGYTEPITIHVPHTSLDLLSWHEKSYELGSFRGTEVYIKLKTDGGIKFYVGIRNKLFEIDSDRYLFFSKHTRFDINCKHLKELRIRRDMALESDANFVF